MSLNYVTITWDVTDVANIASGGYISFAPNQLLTAPADSWTGSTTPKSYNFNTGTGSSDPLVANDNADIAQSGWWYIVTIAVKGQVPDIFNTFINYANGATQKLSSLIPAVSPGPVVQSLPLPSGTPTAGEVPAATGVGEASAWTTLTGLGGVPQGTDGHVSASYMPRPALYSPTGLRRWRAALGDSLFSQVPVVCVGDSITAGVGGDNIDSFNNLPDNSNGWAGQLRAWFANNLGSAPGEGFIFADESRVTPGGGTSNNNWACVPLRHGPRMLHGSGNTLQITIPAGVTMLGVIQGNETQAFNSAGSNLADVSALYSQTGSVSVTNANVTTLTNTGLPVETDIACQPGDVITISAPATAQTYILGFNLKNANPGVLVHRVAQGGYVSGDMLGGQLSGALIQSGSSSNQQAAERACYYWAGSTGLIIVSFGTNDQQFQQGGGSSNQNDVVLSLYTTWMEQFITQAIADGWCCLILGQPRNASPGSGSTLDQYWAAMKSFALSTDHVAFIDVGELWGTAPSPENLGLLAGISSIHPSRRGHGDIARMLYSAIATPAGITELVAA
jgi:lysophospholipase L1-like esterase